MKTIVYLTVNTVNNKFYVGVHGTKTPDVFDGYLGCGCYINMPSSYKKSKTPFQYAVNKYGPSKFRRYTIAIFDSTLDAFKLEEQIVTSDFIKLPFVYNATEGGRKGPDQSVAVYQYTLDGQFIEVYSSYRKAAEHIGCSTTSIANAVKCKSTAQKFLWTTVYYEYLDTSKYHIHDPKCIYEYDKDYKYVTYYNNVTEIIKKYSISRTTINRAIRGKYAVNDRYYSKELLTKFEPQKPISIKGKSIYLYNLDGSFYKEFNSPIECAKAFGLKTSSEISSAIRLGTSFKGYQVYLEKIDSAKVLVKRNQKTPIDQFDLNGLFIKTWPTITSAIAEYGQGVRRCIKGQSRHCKNFIFKLKS